MLKQGYFKKLKNTLMFAFLFLSITPLTLISIFYLYTQSHDLSEQSKAQLVSTRDNQQRQIENYFKAQESAVRSFTRSELGTSSGGRFYAFNDAFNHLGKTSESAHFNAQQRYVTGSGDVLKNTPTSDSPNFTGSERYRLIHMRYHYHYVDILSQSDFSDILLVSLEGTVVYSTKKEENFGTNLITGKYQSSQLANTFRAIKSKLKSDPTPDITPVIFVDFADEKGTQVAWFAAPIIKNDYLHSFILFKLDNKRLSFLIDKSSDKKMRTLVTNADSLSRIEVEQNSPSTISTTSIKQALNGITSVDSFFNEQGESVLAASTAFLVQGNVWALAIELPEKLAYARIRQLEKIFILTLLFAITVVIIASHYLSNSITAPILKLAWIAERIAAGDLNQRVTGTDRDDEIGRLALSFARMKSSINDILLLINKQNEELETNLKLIKQQNNELQLSDKLKDEFLASTSHELRTPLHGMLGISETLISGAYGPLTEQQRSQLNIINNSGQRLSHLVDDLLDYHKMRYGNLFVNKNAVDLASAVHLVLELSNHLIDNKPLRIINQVAEQLPLVIADEQRLEQVLYNLIGNAIKYTPEGKIIIRSNKIEDKIQVQVIDTGHGIEAAQLDHIFEPLSQSNSESPYYRQGAGLGLSISRQLIELMGGQLYVNSQPHIGTTFSFTLPIASEQESLENSFTDSISHFEAPVATEQINLITELLPDDPEAPLIIIADDEVVNLQVLMSYLSLEGFRVKSAMSGRETLDLVNQEKPALVLLDVMMPEMSGYEVCQALRKQYTANQLPVIMLTALNQAKDHIHALEVGANDYVSKPFNQKELTTRINAHLQANQSKSLTDKNQTLTDNLQQQELIETSLLETQGHLFKLLKHNPEAILCFKKDNRIHFANHGASKLFKRTAQQLQHYQLDDVIVKRSMQKTHQHNNALDIYVDGNIQRITASVINLSEHASLSTLIVFCTDNHYDAQRIINLENAVDSLSSYAFDGNREQLQNLKELGGEFTRLVDKAEGKGTDKSKLKRDILVEVMTLTLEYWALESGKTKFELAEQSQLWRVYLDRSTLQTRTLDKYLHIETLPKTPRWRTVLNTIEYVLNHCETKNKQRNKIEQLRSQLQKLVS